MIKIKQKKKKLDTLSSVFMTNLLIKEKLKLYRVLLEEKRIVCKKVFNEIFIKNANITGKMKKKLDFFFSLCYLMVEMKINSIGECYGFS